MKLIRVRNASGKPLLCCWNDCDRDGYDNYKLVVPHDSPQRPGDTLTYIFCGPMHRNYYVSAAIPAEHRGPLGNDLTDRVPRRSPLGLILP